VTRTLSTAEFADLLGVSEWALYESVRRGDPPIPPIRVGRRLLWSRAAVDALLGEDSDPRGLCPGVATNTTTTVLTTAEQQGQPHVTR